MVLMETLTRVVEHPILGFVVLHGSSAMGLKAVAFEQSRPNSSAEGLKDPLLADVAERLEQYFLGEAVSFDGVPLAPEGTPFQQRVWQVLCGIPRGETRSYKWVAQQLGNPNLTRAVGQANGRNPIPIIIPCHRVIQHDGSLGGYTGGLHIKSFLLNLEKHRPADAMPFSLNDYLRPTHTRAMMLL